MKKNKLCKNACILLTISLILTGCGNPFEKKVVKKQTKKDYAITVLSKDELENGHYYIKHGEEFYEILDGDCNFDENTKYSDRYVLVSEMEPDGDPHRSFFYTKDKTELLIPTMYKDDEIVYKSDKEITDTFEWERFLDGGYTVGIRDIIMNNLNKLTFDNWYTSISKDNPLIEDIGIIGEDDEKENIVTYNINAINGVEIDASQVSPAGYITGLSAEENEFDFYKGTELFRKKLKTDCRIFYNFENYWTKGMTFSDDGYVVIKVPSFFRSGYYKTNTSGMFRYINEDYHENFDITAVKYNYAYFKKDKEGHFIYKRDTDNNYIYEEEVTLNVAPGETPVPR